MAVLPEHIERRVTECVEERGLYLLEILRRGKQDSTILEIIVDGESGVTLKSIAELSRAIGTIFDEDEEAISGGYRLEVSTPGLDRPLEHHWQYRKNIGRLVHVLWQEDEGKNRTELFRLIGVSEGEITVEKHQNVKGKKGQKASANSEVLSLSLHQIERVTVEPEI
ncbi:MAG: ribosome assembly cofactor RimP [Ignavibacteriae bacterium]|nr:ribosome assembly cofactor RimP [Ignavibacteriota bacterium]MCB9214524.1 ribosome assembly cofactor RimP [Ignavibacteria bacterium]